jgi:hypothetical protein
MKARAAIEALRTIHVKGERIEWDGWPVYCCLACGDGWPCETRAILDLVPGGNS